MACRCVLVIWPVITTHCFCICQNCYCLVLNFSFTLRVLQPVMGDKYSRISGKSLKIIGSGWGHPPLARENSIILVNYFIVTVTLHHSYCDQTKPTQTKLLSPNLSGFVYQSFSPSPYQGILCLVKMNTHIILMIHLEGIWVFLSTYHFHWNWSYFSIVPMNISVFLVQARPSSGIVYLGSIRTHQLKFIWRCLWIPFYRGASVTVK